MPVNPRSLQNLVNVKLESGVTSEVHRVRAAGDVQEWFKAMTAEERGELLARVMTSLTIHPHQAAAPAFAEGESTTPPVRGPSTTRTAPKKEKSTRAKQTEPREDLVKPAIARLAEHIPVLGVIQKEVPRGLGWKPRNYEKAEVLLSHGDRLFADGVNYRTAKGGVVGYRTAEALFRLGVLIEIKQID